MDGALLKCGGQIPWLVDISTYMYREQTSAKGIDFMANMGLMSTNSGRKHDETKMRVVGRKLLEKRLKSYNLLTVDNVGKSKFGHFVYFILCVVWCYIGYRQPLSNILVDNII